MNIRTALLAVTAQMAIAATSTAFAADSYTTSDLPNIVDASQNNSLRFNRDYLNRPFAGVLHFHSVESSWLNGYMIDFEEASCSTRTKSVVDPMIDWSGGKPVFVTGIIRDTVFGSLMLNDCTFANNNAVAQPSPATTTTTSSAAPAPAARWQDVLPQVKQHCASEWPTDFNMQAYCVERQRSGWEKLNFGQPVTLPPTPAAPAAIVPTPAAPLPSAPTTTTTPNLSPAEQQTTRLVFDYNAYWSQGGRNVEGLAQYYAPKVMYYGNTIAREKVMNEKRTFSARWPIRHYTIKPNSLSVQCENDGPCSATGIVAWDCTSQERGEHSVGTANFAVRIINGVIVSENGSVLTGHKDTNVGASRLGAGND